MIPLQNALKGSFMKHTTLKLNHQAVLDDLPNAIGFNPIISEDFSVDDLLDFSQMSGCDGEDNTDVHDVVSVDEIKKTDMETERYDAVEEICIPADDLAELEWLSHFVEDSFTEYSLTCAVPVKPTTATSEEASRKPTEARIKTATNGGVNSRSFSGSETTSSTSSTTSLSSASTWLIYANPATPTDAIFDSSPNSCLSPLHKAAKMKRKKSFQPSTGNKTGQTRRCSHCGVQKTPQWRAGPLGAKTLCNACGVRFKSGRLLPEYRPACSPTFSSELHSNSHRKVLEMRHMKEVELPESPVFGRKKLKSNR